MRNTIFICLLAMFVLSTTTWAEEEMYLEGISVLGNQKSAYLSMKDGGKIEVHEGNNVGIWKVTKIEERSIFLTLEGGKPTELSLHSRLPTVADQDPKSAADQDLPAETNQDLPSEVQELEGESQPTAETAAEETPPAETPAPATTEEIPPGHRKVHTPFGDFVVKDDTVKMTPDNPPTVPPVNASVPVVTEPVSAVKEPIPAVKNAASAATKPVPVDNSAKVNKPVPSPNPATSSPAPTTPAKPAEPIPPGYRKVQTPFGEFVVEDK